MGDVNVCLCISKLFAVVRNGLSKKVQYPGRCFSTTYHCTNQ